MEIHPKEPMAMCPMASMCKAIVVKPPSLLILMIPGLTFVVIGVLILWEPKILVWLVAAAAILLGISLLMMAAWVRRMVGQFRNAHG